MCAEPNMAVFCSSLISGFPAVSLRYFLNDFQVVPFALVITATTLVFTFHIHCISILTFSHFTVFSAFFLITFLTPEITTSIKIHLFHYHGLRCPVYCWGCFCRFALFDSTTWLLYIRKSIIIIIIIYYFSRASSFKTLRCIGDSSVI